MTEHVLVSPLGFSPGAVSGVYFALKKEKGINVGRVITVGTAHQRVRDAAGTLDRLFRRVGEVDYKACYIDAEELRGRAQDASGPFAARVGLYIDRARKDNQIVHVAVTGGRSGMGALAALAAQIYRAHHLYHLWVDEEIERGGTDPERVRPDPDNKYVNPTVEEGACSLVPLPFVDLSSLIEDAQKYHRSGQVPEGWMASRLVGQGPAMLETLSHYVPAGLTISEAIELLRLAQEWREYAEWLREDDFTRVAPVNDDKAAQQAIWHRMLAILFTAGALDDGSRESLRRLMRESIAGPYPQRKLKEAAQKDDDGIIQWVWNFWEEHKDSIDALASVGQFVVAVIALRLAGQV